MCWHISAVRSPFFLSKHLLFCFLTLSFYYHITFNSPLFRPFSPLLLFFSFLRSIIWKHEQRWDSPQSVFPPGASSQIWAEDDRCTTFLFLVMRHPDKSNPAASLWFSPPPPPPQLTNTCKGGCGFLLRLNLLKVKGNTQRHDFIKGLKPLS